MSPPDLPRHSDTIVCERCGVGTTYAAATRHFCKPEAPRLPNLDAIMSYARTDKEKRFERLRQAIQVRLHVDVNTWEVLRSVMLAEGEALQALAQSECLRRGVDWAQPRPAPAARPPIPSPTAYELEACGAVARPMGRHAVDEPLACCGHSCAQHGESGCELCRCDKVKT